MNEKSSFDKIAECREYIKKASLILKDRYMNSGKKPLANVQTFGCQQNENDSEKIKSFLIEIGYGLTELPKEADLIIFNTCAVRGGAEERVLGNLGALKHLKRDNPELIICVCGCMTQEKTAAEHIKSKFRHVDIIFGTHNLYRFPEYLYNTLATGERIFEIMDSDGFLVEGLGNYRPSKFKAGVSVMYGCNNFCSYCIVPYVRGRERSRRKEDIISEIKTLAENGCKEIMLLGQNVNSYGNDLENYIDFAELLREVNEIDGIERIRFMTSHPKDISDRLIDAIAECDKVCEALHLPFQAGSNRILEQMNRKYTKEHYLGIIEKVKKKIPDITLTSDVIIGFPNETEADVEETIDLVRKVRFDSLFTFIFSPREGTVAAKMEDKVSKEEKHRHFDMLLKVQNEISRELNEQCVGRVYEILVEGESKNNPQLLCGRTRGNKIVNFIPKGAKEGELAKVKITKAQTWALIGEEI